MLRSIRKAKRTAYQVAKDYAGNHGSSQALAQSSVPRNAKNPPKGVNDPVGPADSFNENEEGSGGVRPEG